MTIVNISGVIRPNLPPLRWARNGQYPSAWLAQQLAGGMNHLIYTKGKEVFRHSSGMQNIPAGVAAGTTDRWRFAFHTSKRVSQLWAQITASPAGAAGDSYTRVRIFDNTGLGVFGDAVMHIPSNIAASHFTPAYFKTAMVPVIDTSTGAIATITGDMDCSGLVSDIDSAHVSAVTLWEVPLYPDTSSGYIDPAVAVQSPVTAAFRQGLAGAIADQYKIGSRHLTTWTVENDATPRTRGVNTYINLIDNATLGAPTAATPGFQFDLTNCARSKDSANGVAAKIRVYAKDSVATNGDVKLVNAAGTAVATVSGFTATAAWSTPLAFFLTAGVDKYDLQFKTAAGTLSVYAVSIYLHE